MKKIVLKIILFLLCITPTTVLASPETYVVMDMDSGRVISGNNINKEKLTASISKIMTAHVVIKYGNINDEILVNDSVLKSYGSGIYIKPGEKLKVVDLLYGLMLRSGNDAAIMLADYLSGSMKKFAEIMNNEAKTIGMKNSNFINSHGLEENGIGNKSTAYDMALLMKEAMKSETFKKIVSTKYYKLTTNLNVYNWKNKNRLLFSYEYVIGGKTGFTEKARRTLVTVASKNSKNLIVVTFNDPDDFNTHHFLYEKYFSMLKQNELYSNNQKIFENKNYMLVNKKKINLLTFDNETIRKEIINNRDESYINIYVNDKIIKKIKLDYINKTKKTTIIKNSTWKRFFWGVGLLW